MEQYFPCNNIYFILMIEFNFNIDHHPIDNYKRTNVMTKSYRKESNQQLQKKVISMLWVTKTVNNLGTLRLNGLPYLDMLNSI